MRAVLRSTAGTLLSVAVLLTTAGTAQADEAVPVPMPPSASAPADPIPQPMPTPPGPTPAPTQPAPTPAPTSAPTPSLPLRVGDANAYVSVVHKRLAWLGYEIADREVGTSTLGPSTMAAVAAFARKFGHRAPTAIGPVTWQRLKQQAGAVGTLPKPCLERTSICIDTRQRLVRFVVDGTVQMVADARFGMPASPTRRGTFSVHTRSRDHFSTLYRTSMPYALFFTGGQAVHYSDFFRRDGYAGASHGCVNLRDRAKAAWLFDHSPVGTRVHVY